MNPEQFLNYLENKAGSDTGFSLPEKNDFNSNVETLCQTIVQNQKLSKRQILPKDSLDLKNNGVYLT